MRRKAVSGIMLTLLSIGMFTVALETLLVKATLVIKSEQNDNPTASFDVVRASHDCLKGLDALQTVDIKDAGWTPRRYLPEVKNEYASSSVSAREIETPRLHFAPTSKWDFGRAVEWRDFAYVDENSAELVIGVNGTQTNNYKELLNLVSASGSELVNTVSIGGGEIQAVTVDVPFKTMSSFVSEAQSAGLYRYIEPNLRFEIDFTPNDPRWPRQWGPRKIEADWAWNTTRGDQSVLVAVVDTGIDLDHPDLGDNYVPLGCDLVNNDSDPMDDNGHGTHCAGIIAAVLDNSIGIAGLAQVRIMAEKSFDQLGLGWEDDAANGIIHAVNQGANIISMSWGGDTWAASMLVHEAVKYAHAHGVLVVAAAGNDATDLRTYPAAYDEVIAVTATDENDKPASFTNFGDWVELAAPGVDILSTFWDNGYAYMSGTSMATPHVAGVAALIWSRFPNITADQVRAQLRYTADDLGDAGFDDFYGYGRVNARKAIGNSLPTHDLLLLNWEKPRYVKLGSLATINGTVLNFGTSSEKDIIVQLLVNGRATDTGVVSFLASGASATVVTTWSATVEGFYNVTLYVMPKPGEIETSYNAASAYIEVRAPSILRVPQDYATIQTAIDTAEDGDTIKVAGGIYYEHVALNKSVELVGESKTTTIIDGNGTGIVVHVTANNVNISRFTLRSGYNGINLDYSSYSILRDNDMTGSRYNLMVDGRFLLHYIHDIDTSNTVNRKPIYYWVNQHNKQIPADAGHVAAVNSTNILVKNLNLTRNSIGVLFAYTTGSTIENVTILNNYYGILQVSSFNNNVTSNKISTNVYSFDLLYSDRNMIHDNVISHGQGGVYLLHSNENNISGNRINSNNGYGIYYDFSSRNTFSENAVSDNTYGIYSNWSTNNTIGGNTVLNSNWGIYLDGSPHNFLRDNNMTSNRYNLRVSGYLLTDFVQKIDTSNTVNAKPIYYLINKEGLTVDPSTFPNIGYLGLVNSTNVVVKNLNLTDNGQGLLFAYTTNSLIENVKASNNYYGFYLCGSSGNNLSSNTVTNNEVGGIYLKSGSANNVLSNSASDNKYGIYLQGSHKNTLRDNNMTGNKYNFGIDGGTASDFIQNIDTSNTVDAKPIYYWLNQHNTQVPTNAGYVAVVNSTDITVANLSTVNNVQGILFAYTANSTIMNVIASNNYNGIYLWNSDSTTISGNNVTNNELDGIGLYYSEDNAIVGNTVTDSTYGVDMTASLDNSIESNTIIRNIVGILLYYSEDNIVINNKVSGYSLSLAGIALTEAKGNIMSGNEMAYNTFVVGEGIFGAGIYLEWSSNNNIIVQNTLSHNYYGISIGGWGLYGYKDQSNNNTIYHNNFIENAKQTLSLNSLNIWNRGYPSGGNYWSDYNGTDFYSGPYQNLTGSDGIGDTPYTIDANNKDRFPYMIEIKGPYILGDLNHDGKVDIKDIAVAARTFGSYPNHPRWNPLVDINQDGQVDIRDLALIAKNFGKINP